ncbi:hypothetical protein STEG23_033780 [Scotinomys teguina]
MALNSTTDSMNAVLSGCAGNKKNQLLNVAKTSVRKALLNQYDILTAVVRMQTGKEKMLKVCCSHGKEQVVLPRSSNDSEGTILESLGSERAKIPDGWPYAIKETAILEFYRLSHTTISKILRIG